MLKREVSESGNNVRKRVSAGQFNSEVGTKSSGDDLADIDAINLATSLYVTAGNADRRGPW